MKDSERPSQQDSKQRTEERPRVGGRPGGAPLGTHSLTGGGTNVGMPDTPQEEYSDVAPDEGPGAEEPDVPGAGKPEAPRR